MSNYASKVIAIAKSQVGYREKATNSQLDDFTANAGTGNWTKYARDIDEMYPDLYNGKKNGYDWCAVFVDWCMINAFGLEAARELLCYPTKGCGAGCTASYGYYKEKGRVGTTPKVGAQIFYGTSTNNLTHTGIVEKFDSNYVYTIEGNSGDGVNTHQYSRSYAKIIGYGYPDYDPEPVAGASPSTSTSGSDAVYIVQKGDTLSGIAAKYGTTYQTLAAYNNIADANKISVGQEIKIPGSNSTSSSESASVGTSTSSGSTATKTVKATAAAQSKDSSLAGTYKVTASDGLNVRNGAGTAEKVLVAIPKDTTVKNYGYYTKVSGVKWLYVQFTYQGVQYTGFCSSAWLKKV